MPLRYFTPLLAALLLATPALAHEFGAKGVSVIHPWVRATPGGSSISAAFLEIKSADGVSDRLVGAKSTVAGRVELHTHIHEGDIMKMRRVDSIAVPPGTSVVLKPSGDHVMLFDLKGPLKEGDPFKLTLVFEKAGEIEVEGYIEPVGAMGPHGFDKQPVEGAGHNH